MPDVSCLDVVCCSLQLDTFAAELKALGKTLAAQQGSEDAEHLYKIVRWSRTCTAVGVATAVYCVNPISALLLALGCMTRWTIVAHHVCHGGFDRVDTGGRYNRFSFGVGSLWRRCVDWLDWMLVEAWNAEHNQLHHYHLGESGDPDLVERNLRIVRDAPAWTLPLKCAAAFGGALIAFSRTSRPPLGFYALLSTSLRFSRLLSPSLTSARLFSRPRPPPQVRGVSLDDLHVEVVLLLAQHLQDAQAQQDAPHGQAHPLLGTLAGRAVRHLLVAAPHVRQTTNSCIQPQSLNLRTYATHTHAPLTAFRMHA